jgi:hypothetical protein
MIGRPASVAILAMFGSEDGDPWRAMMSATVSDQE